MVGLPIIALCDMGLTCPRHPFIGLIVGGFVAGIVVSGCLFIFSLQIVYFLSCFCVQIVTIIGICPKIIVTTSHTFVA